MSTKDSDSDRLKIVLYHRCSTIAKDDDIKEIRNTLYLESSFVPNSIVIDDMIIEKADKIEDQSKLADLITNVKFDIILTYSLNTLVNAPFVRAMDKVLEILDNKIQVRFYNTYPSDIEKFARMYESFQEERIIERNRLSASRMKINGTNVGARPLDINWNDAISLRKEGKTFREIAHELDCSTGLVYSKIPVELRGSLGSKIKKRMRKLKERIEQKRNEDKRNEDKINGKGELNL